MHAIPLKYFLVPLLLLASTLSAEEKNTQRVFFLGNSLTSWADLPRQVAGFAESRGASLDYLEQMRSGQGMKNHWETGLMTGPGALEAPARKTLRQGSWDAVILQPMSREFLLENREEFFTYASRFVELIPEETTIFLYAYWPYISEPLELQDTINAAFEEVRSRLADTGRDVRILPVGEAFRQAVELGFRRERLYLDQLHASHEGMYLAALVKYAALFNQDPQGLPAQAIRAESGNDEVIRIAEDTAAKLQSAAWNAVKSARNSSVH